MAERSPRFHSPMRRGLILPAPISGWAPFPPTCGVALVSSSDSTVEGNRLLGSLETYNSIFDIGIFVDSCANVLISANQISRGGTGMRFQGNTTARYRDNFLIGVLTSYQNNATTPANVTDAGGNN